MRAFSEIYVFFARMGRSNNVAYPAEQQRMLSQPKDIRFEYDSKRRRRKNRKRSENCRIKAPLPD